MLLVEDNPINQRVATAMLEHLGFDVDAVTDGHGAVTAALQMHYRAVFMDCQIPGLDGCQATAEIRRRQEPDRRTPIIAITASATNADQQRCLAAGMDDFLAKPLTLKALAAILARWAPEGTVAAIADDPAASLLNDTVDPGPADSGRAVLDADVVARLERLGAAAGEDLMAALATLFLADADARIVALRQALADGDPAAIVRSAHSLTGSSANLGATALSRLCATLATGSAAADLVARQALVDGIEVELGRVRNALSALVPAA